MPEHEERVHFMCSPLPTPVLLSVSQEEVGRGLSLVLCPADGQCLGKWDKCPDPSELVPQAWCFPELLLCGTPPTQPQPTGCGAEPCVPGEAPAGHWLPC